MTLSPPSIEGVGPVMKKKDKKNLVNSFIYVKSITWLQWNVSGFLAGSSLGSLALKQQQTITFHLLLAVVLWQLQELQMLLLSCTASSTGTCARTTTFVEPCSIQTKKASSTDVGEPTCHPCSTTGMLQETTFSNLEGLYFLKA